jgi:hypothetical protein
VGCHVCGTRQTDPARGASPWQRGVVAGVQVLGCPACQRSGTWASALDRCAACSSAALVRRLGDTVCRDCGHVGDGVAAAAAPPPVTAPATTPVTTPPPAGDAAPARDAGRLADEVAAALDRFFGRA